MYARVSTGRQENEATIESQIDEIKSRIASDGHILPAENVFLDDGWTSDLLARPALDLLRDAIKVKTIQVVYVYDLGRLSRDFLNQLILIDEIKNAEIPLVSLHDINPENTEQILLQRVTGLFYDYERVKIAERMRRGKLYKAKQGLMINGSALYGYRYIKKTGASPTHYEINEEESGVVLMLFDWIGNERISVHQAIKRLYELKILPRKGKSAFWTKGPIARLLRCKTYVTGIAHYNKSESVISKKTLKKEKYRKVKKNSRKARPQEEWIPIKVPVLFEDRTLFDKVQTILEYNKKYAKKNRKYDYLLSGRVWCECGNRRTGDGYTNNHYYRCTERIHKFPTESLCKSPGINAPALDSILWENLSKFFDNPKLLKKHAEQWMKVQNENLALNQQKARLEILIEKVVIEEHRYSKAYGEGLMEFEQFKSLVKDTQKRKADYKEQFEALKRESSHTSRNFNLNEFCEEATKVLKTLDITNKKLVINDIIDKVIIKGRQEVEVQAHVPLSSLKMAYETIYWDRWTP